jgi:hypothetical protein
MAFNSGHLNGNLFNRLTNTLRPANTVVVTAGTRQNLILPDVLAVAKNHFACSTITGIPLENELSFSQFYWERRFFFEDVSLFFRLHF